MATAEQRTALLAVPCPWCYAPEGEVCSLRQRTELDTEGGRRRRAPRAVTTLDGGCHDARWRKALGTEAPVLAGAVTERHGREHRTPVLAGAGDRPW